MSEIRNLTRNGETFYPLTCTEGLVNRDGNVVGEINDIFDISEYNASGTPPVLAKYDTLSLALAAVPSGKQKGGMTIRYVQTSDNKYVQYRLMSDSFNTTVANWQGVDDEPTSESDNLVKSGGVANLIKNINNTENFAFVLTDAFNHLIATLDKDFLLNLDMYNIHTETVESNEYEFVIVDKFNHVILYRKTNENFVLALTDKEKEEIKLDAYERNIDNLKYAIGVCCSHGIESGVRTLFSQFMVVTDSHTYPNSYEDAILVASKLPSCIATIHLGDIENQVGMNGDIESRFNLLYAKGPAYATIGNHDSGEYGRALTEISVKAYLYEVMIEPLIVKGWLNEGEYVDGELYYFRDFDEYNTRLIVLDNFDVSETLADNDYWEPVEYNETYSDITQKNYSVGEYINIPKYSNSNTYSFRCKQETTVSFSTYDDKTNQPYIKECKRNVWYQEKQLTWLCNTLKSAAEKGNKCIIASHQNVIYPNNVDFNCGFTSRYSGFDISGYTYRFTDENKGIISDIVNAFHTKGTISKTMNPQGTYEGDINRIDDVSSEQSFEFTFDFSSVEETVQVFFICGHKHYDFVTRHNLYQNQVAIGFTQSDLSRATKNDVGLLSTANKDNDIFTVCTFIDDDIVHLSRLGRCVSNRILNGKAVSKDNEIVRLNNVNN